VGLIEFLLSSMAIVSLGEGLNCYYPMHDGEYENSGMVCQWKHDSFYYDKKEEKWILFPEDPDDNFIEREMRKRYWKKKQEKK